MTEITKMVMIGLIGALVIGVLIGFIVINAYGEALTIEGATNTHGIFISMEGTENIIMWDTLDGYSEHFDGKLKTYNSGGFSLKNPESGIAVWGHPVTSELWRLVILTSDGVVRMPGNTVIINDITTVNSTTTIESQSSIGADISRYDIPTTGRSDHIIIIPEKEFDPDTLEILSGVPHSVQWTHDLNFDFMVVDTAIKSEMDSRIKNAWVEMTMINPIGQIIGTWNGSTDNLGNHGNSWHVEDNEMIGEYTLNATANYENFTQKSLLVSFFVTPLNNDGSSAKCPNWYFYNDTSNICEEVK